MSPVWVKGLLILAFALLTALGAKLNVDFFELPLTLQTPMVYGSGLLLGARNGFFAQVVYLGLGLFFPVFAGDGFGLAYLFTRASSGYLLAFPLVALLVGLCSQFRRTFWWTVLALEIGSVFLFTAGVCRLHFVLEHESWAHSFYRGWFRLFPLDFGKILLTALVYTLLRQKSRVDRVPSEG